MKKLSCRLFLISILLLLCEVNSLYAQPELMAWGNLTGIRIEGQLMEFESSLRVVEKGWQHVAMTAKERQRPRYDREGKRQTITTAIGGILFTEVVLENADGSVKLAVNTSSEADTLLEGVFLCFDLPGTWYGEGSIQFTGKTQAGISSLDLKKITIENNRRPFSNTATGVVITSPKRQLEIDFNSGTNVYLRREPQNDSNIQLYIELMGSKIKKGQESENQFSIKAGGEIDHTPAEILLDEKNPGWKFDGLGGNFRLQNPTSDPPVIQYCLDSLRVAWGRVEMPWQLWHPDENTDPIKAAEAGNLHPHVHASMEMAQRLARKGMPVIVSDWQAPAWAIIGDPMDAYRYRSKGIFGYPLDPEKMERIYQSIGDYLVYLKQNYGVEAVMFSFNESDLGINVRHTGEEHATFIKEMGAHLASRGLATKLLLGDNSDANTFDFIIPAMNDPETHKYIGAISFHSWRGCTPQTLEKWAGAARKMNLPLLVAEGSTDAAAWNYPEIFSEQSFALHEINLYVRICAACQPLSILQWQLTADYSVMVGNGIFGTNGPLRPTQRFWNLKQLASTPENSFSIPLTCSKEGINCAAFGNLAKGEYAIHLVNNGAKCEATISGIPSDATEFDVYVTDSGMGMVKTGTVQVSNGTTKLTLHPAAFTTLLTKK